MFDLPISSQKKLLYITLFLASATILVSLLYAVFIQKSSVFQPQASSPTFKKDNGEKATIPQTLSENEALLFPGARILETVSFKGGDTVTFQTEKSLEDVNQFYQEKLSSLNWHFNLSQKIPDSAYHYSISKEKLVGGISLIKSTIYSEIEENSTPTASIIKVYTVIKISLNNLNKNE